MFTDNFTDDQAKEATRKALGVAIAKNRPMVVALLKKYGVAIDNSYTDDELIVGVLQAVRSDKRGRFKADLAALLGETVKLGFTAESGQEFFGFTAEQSEKFFGFNLGALTGISKTAVQNTQAAQATSSGSAPKEKSAFGAALSANLGNIFGTGLNVLSTSLTNKSNQKLADTALQIEAEKTKQAALIAAGGGAGGAGAAPGLSTGAKVAIGVGVATILGVIIYFIAKKK